MEINPFQGGLPAYRTRYNQRGSGFLSALKRFVVPIARTVLPHVLGGVSDVVRGDSTPMQALKRRGADLVTNVAAPHTSDSRPPTKKYKRAVPPPQKKQKKKKPQQQRRRIR